MHNYPIIFVHTGNAPYLHVAIQKAKQTNKDAEVILIGDDANKNIPGISHYPIATYFNSAQEFEENYYIHLSKNKYSFEIICYQRWFILNEFTKEKNYEKFWYLDSDVLVFSNLSKYLDTTIGNNHYDFVGLDSHHCPEINGFNPGFNLFTQNVLNNIIIFFKDSYKNPEILNTLKTKWKKHNLNNLPGGVCDMTQFKLFFLSNPTLKIYNSYSTKNDLVCEGNIYYSSNYVKNEDSFKMQLGIKEIIVKENRAYAFLENGERKELIASHFQGNSKPLMIHFAKKNYTTKNIIQKLPIFKLYLKNTLRKNAKKLLKRIK